MRILPRAGLLPASCREGRQQAGPLLRPSVRPGGLEPCATSWTELVAEGSQAAQANEIGRERMELDRDPEAIEAFAIKERRVGIAARIRDRDRLGHFEPP
jgi:hypothetical protein